MFLISGIARQFEIGNPAYVAGRNGCEVAKEVIVLSGLDMLEAEDLMYLDKSPEYWTGWALAYYQWKSGQSFRQIDHAVSIDTVCAMYDPLHEADIEKFVYIMNEKLKQQDVSRLRRLRTYANFHSGSWQKRQMCLYGRYSFLSRENGILIRHRE